ncbi:hypothetical protein VSAK1_18589 [Vibrio mediterranei AK1]|nr:hypothetical protein VSAK1_18589 [Vibrio mediterranei AK1]
MRKDEKNNRMVFFKDQSQKKGGGVADLVMF